jgi:hypothetical protein
VKGVRDITGSVNFQKKNRKSSVKGVRDIIGSLNFQKKIENPV